MISATQDNRVPVRSASSLQKEPDAHAIARHLRTVLRGLILVAALATVICLFYFQEQAYLAAIPIPILLFLLLGASWLERNSRAKMLRRGGQAEITKEEVEIDEDAVALSLVLKLAGVFALAAIIVAASFFNWEIVGLAAATLFAMAILIGLPYWPLIISDARAEEEDKLLSREQDAQ